MSSVENEKLIARVRKLMALAAEGSGATEAEAAAAAEKVQDLLAQHNLDLAVVGDESTSACTRGREVKVGNAAYKYQTNLMRTLAELNFCMVWVEEQKVLLGAKEQTRKVYVLLGRHVNILTTCSMYDYLHNAIERLLPYPNAQRLSRSAQSWKLGCSERLIQRLRDRAQQRNATQAATKSTANALTLTSVYAAEYAANYDARWGAGAYARSQAYIADYERTREQRAAEATAAEELEAERRAGLTDKQRQAEDERAQRARERSDACWERQWRASAARIDSTAYYAGHAAGDEIGLDAQLSRKERALQLT